MKTLSGKRAPGSSDPGGVVDTRTHDSRVHDSCRAHWVVGAIRGLLVGPKHSMGHAMLENKHTPSIFVPTALARRTVVPTV